MKVIYLNKETGKEVHYGDSITFKETGEFSNGYSYERVSTLPVINATIPDLIKKGVLVQKEIKEEKKSNETPKEEYSIEKKLDILAGAVTMLIEQVRQIQEDFYEDDDE